MMISSYGWIARLCSVFEFDSEIAECVVIIAIDCVSISTVGVIPGCIQRLDCMHSSSLLIYEGMMIIHVCNVTSQSRINMQ